MLHRYGRKRYQKAITIVASLGLLCSGFSRTSDIALSPVLYSAAQLQEVHLAAHMASLPMLLLPQLGAAGSTMVQARGDGNQVVSLVYPNLTVRESSHLMTIEGASSYKSVPVRPGITGTWLTWKQKSGEQHAFEFQDKGVHVTMIPTDDGVAWNSQVVAQIAASVATLQVADSSVRTEPTAVLEQVQVTDTGVVITTTHQNIAKAYSNPHLTDGLPKQFVFILHDIRPGRYAVNQPILLASKWARVMTMTQVASDLVVTFDLVGNIQHFGSAIGAGDTLQFTFS